MPLAEMEEGHATPARPHVGLNGWSPTPVQEPSQGLMIAWSFCIPPYASMAKYQVDMQPQ